ncbi:hypothetical protein HMPREF9093_02179 [Fusobacterium sp. oral taxon 370 str. F0437]|nr:hypothetical protein HMPREF9093_02179 [Fusobacterium sp. oral taxon 370 str. F0437]
MGGFYFLTIFIKKYLGKYFYFSLKFKKKLKRKQILKKIKKILLTKFMKNVIIDDVNETRTLATE